MPPIMVLTGAVGAAAVRPGTVGDEQQVLRPCRRAFGCDLRARQAGGARHVRLLECGPPARRCLGPDE